MTIVVAGATGKAGREIVLRLSALNKDVLALCRDSTKFQFLPSFVKKVIIDYEDDASLCNALEGCEGIINALGVPEQYMPNKDIFYKVNVLLAIKLFKIAERCSLKRFIHISTVDVFEQGAYTALSEEQPIAVSGRSPYVNSKITAERELQKLAVEYNTELVIVNPSGIFGPASVTGSIDTGFIRPILKEKLPFIPPGSMSLLYEESFGHGVCQAYLLGRRSNNYLLCDDTLSTLELATLLVEIAGLKRLPKQINPKIAMLLANISERLAGIFKIKPILSRGELDYLLTNIKIDTSKAQRELKWLPASIEDSISAYITSYSSGG